MSSLAATLLARSSATVQTRQALIITGLQNDFISPDGKLALKTRSAFIERIIELIPIFREHGHIIWVWTEYRGNRTVNDPSGNGCMVMIPEDENEDEPASRDPSREQGSASRTLRGKYPRSTDRNNEIIARAMRVAAELDLIEDDEESQATTQSEDPELFLSETATRQACCKPGTWGAEPIPEIKDLIRPGDIHITKSFYSAFTQTSLLFQLRAKLVTDLYFAGVNTNLSVYATATDAARHGLEINIIRNCMGCRQVDRHEEAIKQMVDYMGAQVTTAHSVVSRLRGEDVADDEETEDPTDEDEDEDGQSSTGPVRQFPFSQDQSEGSVLKEAAPVTTQLKARGTPFEPAQSPSSESATTAARFSFDGGSEDDKNEKATPADELGRQHISTSESVIDQAHAEAMPGSWIDYGENKADAAGHRLAVRTSQSNLDGSSSKEPMTHNASAATAAAPSIPQADIHRDTINPPIVSKTARSESRLSPADVAGETLPARERSMHKPNKKKSWQKGNPTLGPGDSIGSGDSSIVFDLLPPTLSDTIFQQLLHEVHWQRMYHAAGEVPRLVCCQGDIGPLDGTMPVYRHPSDYTLPLLHWSPGVARIRREAEKRVGHGLNHVLIQLYRNGQDNISEHTDKTLDILPGSSIVNVSFGAQRTMRLRTKRAASSNPSNEGDSSSTPPNLSKNEEPGAQRTTQRIPMPHNSMLIMGLATNIAWLHGITADKRLDFERTPAELAYNGMRISLTFRNINTYLSADSRKIWGQGATSKDRSTARSTINGDAASSQRLIDAFGIENQSTMFDWHTTYGTGFDVLHLKMPLEDDTKPTLFLSGDEHADLAVKLYLIHLGVSFHETPSNLPPPPDVAKTTLLDSFGKVHPIAPIHHGAVAFRDTDLLHTIVSGESAILLYLDRAYARYLLSTTPAILLQAARELELLTSSLLAELRDLLRRVTATYPAQAVDHLHEFQALKELDDYLLDNMPRNPTTMTSTSTLNLDDNAPAGRRQEESQNRWLAGAEFGIADCAFWSVIQAFRALFIERFARSYPGLNEWARRVQGREEISRLRDGSRRRSREHSGQSHGNHDDDDENKEQ